MKIVNQLFAFACIGLLLASCSATQQLTMSTTEPAPLKIADKVQHIGIINRSLPIEENRGSEPLDKILSLEGENLDKNGAEAALASVKYELERMQRFDKVVILDEIPNIKKALGVLPAALTWDQVDEICNAYKVDILFALAFYDTDTRPHVQAAEIEMPNAFGVKKKVPAVGITLHTKIRNGWRIYDPATKEILDSYSFANNLISQGEGINTEKAVNSITNRKEQVLQASSHIGDYYANRITPKSLRVTRDYFVRGTDKFDTAMHRAQSGQWADAAKLWEEEVLNPNGKIAGRACYNMAIINEIKGDLDCALDWVQRSFTDYDTKEALRYMNILRYRISQKKETKRQLAR